jgi:HrpA-like RNA helicase
MDEFGRVQKGRGKRGLGLEGEETAVPTTLGTATLGTAAAPKRTRETQGAIAAREARVLEEGAINLFTGRPFTPRYRSILAVRQGLPVHQQREEFLDLFHAHQILIFVGETGSGKTTQ